MIKKETKIDYEILVFVAFVFLTLSVLLIYPIKFDVFVVFSFILNALLWSILFFCELKKFKYSFCLVHWLFLYIFFFIAAYCQYANGYFPWIKNVKNEYLLKTNIVLFIYSIFFLVGCSIASTRKKISYNGCLDKKIVCSTKKVIVLTFICFIILIYRIITIGFSNLFSRHTSSLTIIGPQAVLSLVHYISVGVMFFSCILSIVRLKNNISLFNLFLVFINFSFLFVAFSPFSVARYLAGVVYITIILILFKQKFIQTNLFSIIFVFGICIILPFLNAFRNTDFLHVDVLMSLSDLINNFNKNWLAGDYDAYTMVAMTLEYVDLYGATFLHQLLGAFLFFIPRVIWPTKPVGSGYFVSKSLGYPFNNVSCPLPAESVINMGYLGIFVFPVILGFILRKGDLLYWHNLKFEDTKFSILYPALVIVFFMICRGDLMSGMSFIAGIIFSWLILVFL